MSIQNVGGSATNITIEYYDTDGNLIKTLGPDQGTCRKGLPAKATCVVYNPPDLEDPDTPGKFLGSARVYSSGQDIVGMVHENALDINRFMSHLMALADNSKTIFFPRQGKQWSEGGTKWTAASMIMNVGDQATDVSVQLYDENGSPSGAPITKGNLPARAGFSTWPSIPIGFKGSAVATSSGEPIVAEVNYVNNGPNGNDPPPAADTGSSFNGANR